MEWKLEGLSEHLFVSSSLKLQSHEATLLASTVVAAESPSVTG